ncbi:MAG: DUF6328 family protein [Actinomycetota bacterium]
MDGESKPDRGADAPDPQQRDKETLDRELDELSSELRTVIPGVTVLLGFLLSVPFASGFPALDGLQRGAYFTAFLATTLAVVFLTGESAYHRLRGKPYDKGRLLKTANRQMVTALLLLGVALTAVVLLVTDVLFGTALATSLAAGVVVLVALTWFGLPLFRRGRKDARARPRRRGPEDYP